MIIVYDKLVREKQSHESCILLRWQLAWTALLPHSFWFFFLVLCYPFFAHVIVSSSSNSVQRLFFHFLYQIISFVYSVDFFLDFCFVSISTFNKVLVNLLPSILASFIWDIVCPAHIVRSIIHLWLFSLFLYFAFVLVICFVSSLFLFDGCIAEIIYWKSGYPRVPIKLYYRQPISFFRLTCDG